MLHSDLQFCTIWKAFQRNALTGLTVPQAKPSRSGIPNSGKTFCRNQWKLNFARDFRLIRSVRLPASTGWKRAAENHDKWLCCMKVKGSSSLKYTAECRNEGSYRTASVVFLSVQLKFSIGLHINVSNASNFSLSAVVIVKILTCRWSYHGFHYAFRKVSADVSISFHQFSPAVNYLL